MPPGTTYCTYWVHVPALGVGYVPGTVAPQVVCETEGGAVCGGYAPKGYAGYGEYRGSIAAFLFSWPDGDVSAPVIKLQKVGGSHLVRVRVRVRPS